MPLLLALTALILVEIALFVTVGSWIGLGLTLLELLVSALSGALVLRTAWRGLAQRIAAGSGVGVGNPVALAGQGALLALAGVLLILPGFLTDLVGLLLLVPPVRTALAASLGEAVRRGLEGRVTVMTRSGSSSAPMGSRWPDASDPIGGEVVDAEVIEAEPVDATPDETRRTRP